MGKNLASAVLKKPKAKLGTSTAGKAGKKPQPKKDLHPNSRKAARLHGSLLRDSKIQKLKTESEDKRMKRAQRVYWYKENITEYLSQQGRENQKELSYDEICNLIQSYIDRNKEELEEIEAENKARKRRTNASREDAIRDALRRETEEFKAGWVAPDFRRPKVVQQVKDWQLELNVLPSLATATFKRKSK
eukprot:m.341336 g.341336  ORF g.341336 m.341336 type:complete len:190 (+) comp20016_c0_seq1:135-704(+)